MSLNQDEDSGLFSKKDDLPKSQSLVYDLLKKDADYQDRIIKAVKEAKLPKELLAKVAESHLLSEMSAFNDSTINEQIKKLVEEGKLPKEAGLPEEEKLKKLKELGNRFNQGKLPWHLVDFRALESGVKVLDYGAKKYVIDQWKNGLSKKEILDSLLRHTFALLAGEVNDKESGESHIGHMFCNVMFYSYFTEVDPTNARD